MKKKMKIKQLNYEKKNEKKQLNYEKKMKIEMKKIKMKIQK